MSLDYKTAFQSFQSINDSHLTILKDSLFKAAIRYSEIRVQWQFLNNDERSEINQERTAAHNRFIDCCNSLSKQQSLNNEDNSWRNNIGKDRKLVGDFACYLHCFIGIQNR
jgi:hypothetical protein